MDSVVPPENKLMAAGPDQERAYRRNDVVVFRTTSGSYGGLSNMAPGFPLVVSGVRFWTAEALYQVCRFPNSPDVQNLIIHERSPMTAKMKSKRYRQQTRPDWDAVRVKIMKWCLRVKLLQHHRKFGELLRATEGRSIVEESAKDQFWGAKPCEDGMLRGKNVLGRLLMELREEFLNASSRFDQVDAPDIADVKILGKPVGVVRAFEDPVPHDSLAMPLLQKNQEAGQSVHITGNLPRDHWIDLLHFLSASGIAPEQASVDFQLHFRRDIPTTSHSKIRLLSELARRYGLRIDEEESK